MITIDSLIGQMKNLFAIQVYESVSQEFSKAFPVEFIFIVGANGFI